MTMMSRWNGSFLIALAAVVSSGGPALAIHRHTPPIVRITNTGDYTLPRLPVFGQTLLLSIGSPGHRGIFGLRTRDLVLGMSPQPLSGAGDNTNPVGGRGTRLIAWDSTGSPVPGRQLVLQSTVNSFPDYFNDPTGTSANPSVSRKASSVAWESRGNLAGTGSTAGRRIFFLRRSDPTVRQLSRGQGDSRNAALGSNDSRVAFDSTSDPVSGADTHVPQIWVADTDGGTAEPITHGAGASEFPSMSQDSRVMVFQSRAALDGDGHDTGVSQIFAYDTFGGAFARLTSHPAGCTQPSVRSATSDFRIAYMCGSQAFYTELRSGQQFVLPIVGGETTRVVTELGTFFLIISTTSDLLGTGTTTGHQLYLWNLFKRPALPVASALQWFPVRGLSQL